MRELGPGDFVETSRDYQTLEHERWLWDVHGSMGAAQATVRAEFVAITHAGSERALRLTAGHLLFLKKQGAEAPRMSPAGDASVGDEVLVRSPTRKDELVAAKVTSVETVMDF